MASTATETVFKATKATISGNDLPCAVGAAGHHRNSETRLYVECSPASFFIQTEEGGACHPARFYTAVSATGQVNSQAGETEYSVAAVSTTAFTRLPGDSRVFLDSRSPMCVWAQCLERVQVATAAQQVV